MPIPYRDVSELDELGTAGYLRVEPCSSGSGYVGALFLINARGEPVEFTYNKIDTPHTFLWRQGDIRRHAARKLTTSLLSLCPKVPRLILCLAREVGSELFCQDIHVSVPVCRVAPTAEVVSQSGEEKEETMPLPEPINIFWFPEMPAEDCLERRLLQVLGTHGLLLEPFERASIGLREVYPDKVGTTK